MGRKGMYGGRNKMKLNFHFLLFILWTCSTFSQMNENALLSLLFQKKVSQIPLFSPLYFHSFLGFLNDMADKSQAQMTFSLSATTALAYQEPSWVFILNSRFQALYADSFYQNWRLSFSLLGFLLKEQFFHCNVYAYIFYAIEQISDLLKLTHCFHRVFLQREKANLRELGWQVHIALYGLCDLGASVFSSIK